MSKKIKATNAPALKCGIPHPDSCELYLVNRDTLFSFNKASEAFLFNMMSLFISSRTYYNNINLFLFIYKNLFKNITVYFTTF